MSSYSTPTTVPSSGGYPLPSVMQPGPNQPRMSSTMASSASGSSSVDVPILGQIETLLKTLNDPSQRDDLKLKAIQEISDHFEVLITTPAYPALMENLLRIFIKLLNETTPQFIGENNTQQLRKLLLEIVHRMPCNEHMKAFAPHVNKMLFKLVETENEENVLVCLRIIIELEKQFRPAFIPEVQQFLSFVKTMYRDLPLHVHNIFEPHPSLQVAEIQNLDIENALQSAFTVVHIQTQQKLSDGGSVVYTLLPRGKQSLKVLAELPIIVVLLYQVHKQNVQQDISDFIPLVLNTIVLTPSPQQKCDQRFNRDIFIDFMAAQIKALSFVAFLGRVYQDTVNMQASCLVKGIITLLASCPHEIAHLRKELMVATRHILGTELRMKFIPYISQLFEENLLVGTGFTANENLRPLAYSTLADLVHHVRQQLPIQSLTGAVYLFARCAHDPTIACGIQTMACKLLLNLVDCISKQQETGVARDLLLFMLDVFVRKFKVVAMDYLPQMFEKCEKRRYDSQTSGNNDLNTSSSRIQASGNTTSTADTPTVESKTLDTSFMDTAEPKDSESEAKQLAALMHSTGEKEEKFHFGAQQTAASFSLADARALVKTLVCGVKTITWGLGAGRVSGNEQGFSQARLLLPRDTSVFVRLLKYGMQALDVYMVSPVPGSNVWQKRHHTSPVQSKDEKDVLEHFAGLFTLLNLQTFKEIFSTNIDFLVERISENLALQSVPHAFLINVNTSPVFATVLMEYLIKRLGIMGTHEEQSNLCLKLYKTVFGSVSLFAAENEQMLRPHLHKLVNSCLEMSLTAKEPYNYFLLLRGLFRSIGGGSHDLLYQEFLPLLPGLLKNLNNLQNGYHRQQMKELLVELCLTVPVRLSSLVPHLPMLMEPLVSALSGSPSLILQGLRTLELCIDNLQPEFLHEHMAPVRPQMMQALAKILNTSGNDQAATAAWRTIGKLGGLNRRMLTDMQLISHAQQTLSGPLLSLAFVDSGANVEIPLSKAIRHASSILRQSSTDLNVRLRCFRMIRAFLVSLVTQPEQALLEGGEKWFYSRFQNAEPVSVNSTYRCQDTIGRSCCVEGLTAVLHAATSKDTRQEALPFVNSFIRYLTILAASEQTGPQALKEQSYHSRSFMDSSIVSDAIANVMADEDKELCKAGILAVTLVLDTTSQLLGSKEKAPDLPLIQCINKTIVQLCYEPAWYSKLGGCSGIKYLLENFPASWVSKNAGLLVDALLYVVVDSMGQIANGALDIAKLDLELLVKALCQLESIEERNKAIFRVVEAIVPSLTSWSAYARDEATGLLEMIAERTGTSVVQLVLPHMQSSVLDFLGIPKGTMDEVSVHCRIGILAAFTYLVNDQLSNSKFDPCGEAGRNVFSELVGILDGDKTIAQALPGFEKEAEMSLTQLKTFAANAILSWKDIKEFREKTFSSLFKTLNSDVPELQETAFQCLQKFGNPETDMLHTTMRPLLLLLSDFKSVTLPVAKKLLYLTKLFPTTFNEKLCDQLLAHLKKWLEVAAASPPPKTMQQFMTPEMENCTVIVEIFHHIPAASSRFVEPLVGVLGKAEAAMNIEVGSPWRNALLKFLIKYPTQTVEFFLMEANLRDEHMSNMFLWILKQEAAKQCRDVLQNNPVALVNFLSTYGHASARDGGMMGQERLECAILRLMSILAKRDRTWLPKNQQLVEYLRNLWNSPDFRARYAEDSCDSNRLKAPRSVAKCLFYYFQANTSEIGLLYDLLTCFTEKFNADFEWLKKYLDKDIAVGFSIEWKRHAFLRFLDIYGNPNIDVRLKTKILQYVVIPCVQRAFEKGEVDQLIGSVPAPEFDSDDNLISVFLQKVIDTIDTQRLSVLPDVLLILLYQLTCLFVEYAAPHIHDTNSKKQGARLRKVMLFGWPCLQQNNSLDPSARYYGHLLIAHIIEKFAINRKIVLQVFHSLLKAHGQEARHVVRHALNILTPAVPQRMEDGHAQLAQFAKKLIVEEGHSTPQLIHILQVVIRHYKLFFVVRHQLLQHLVNAIQKLVVQAGTVENKKLAVDVCETIIKWELRCLKKDDGDQSEGYDEAIQSAMSKPDGQNDELTRRIDKPIVETTLNFLLRLACYVPDQNAAAQNAGGNANMEVLSKRCLHLIKVALKPDLWGLKAELKLQWLEKALAGAVNDQTQSAQNLTLCCTCLDVLTYLISVLPSSQVLNTVRSIQRGITFCLGCQNHQVIKSLHNFLVKLLTILNSEVPPLGSIESLEVLGMSLMKMLHDTFTNYEKVPALGLNGIYGAVSMLKAVCSVDPTYIERVLPPFVKALQKLAREHTGATNQDVSKSSADMLSLCLDLVRPRVEMMNGELRKQFLQNVLYILLDKSNNAKVISSIMKHLSDWMKLAPTAAPGIRERQALLLKLSMSVEKKFANETEILKSFLELVYFVYKDNQLRTTDLPSKLESAFLLGLCQSDPETRGKFFEIFDGSIRKNPYDRLFYIMCTQNWEPLQQHYWAKQCIELILAMVDRQRPVILKSIATFGHLSGNGKPVPTPMDTGMPMKLEPSDTYSQANTEMGAESQEIIDFDSGHVPAWTAVNASEQLRNLWQKQMQFLQSIRNNSISDILPFLIELCHSNTELAENVWISLLKSTFSILDDSQRQNLTNEIVPFLCSNTHLAQRNCHPSVLRSFVEAFSLSPSIFIKPSLLQYLGRSHGLWHRSILLLEKSLDSIPSNVSLDSVDDAASAEKLEIFDSLCELYSSLNEQDLWASIWFQRARYPDTKTGLRYEELGAYDTSADIFEKAMMREQMDFSNTMMNLNVFQEMRLWEQHWSKCMQELNQWESLKDLSTTKTVQEPFLSLECAWRLPNWNLMKEALVQVESSCPKEMAWKLALYRGYLLVGSGEDQHSNNFDKLVEQINQLLIKEWRRLPKMLSQSHGPLLQAAQQVMELQEAAQLVTTMQSVTVNRSPNIHEMKSVVKTWRNRSPAVFDSLSHWSHVLAWRLLHYKNLVQTLENDPHQSQSSLLGVHASATCLLQFAKVARRRGLLQLAVDTLNRLHTIPNLPVIDGFQKLREQVKCCLKASSVNTKNSEAYHGSPQEGLDIIENSNVSYFNKETSADLYALKGMVLSQLDRRDETTRAFSTSLQLNDGAYRTWGAWADHLELVYSKERDPTYAGQAVICNIQAARLVPEVKARKFIVRIFWLLKLDTDGVIAKESFSKYALSMPPINWLFWLPQLVELLKETGSQTVIDILMNIGKAFPEAALFAMYPYLGAESGNEWPKGGNNFHANVQRIAMDVTDAHPCVGASIFKIMTEMINKFAPDWSEKALTELRNLLQECYRYAFENRNDVQATGLSSSIVERLARVRSVFASENDEFASSLGSSFGSEFDTNVTNIVRRLSTVIGKRGSGLVKWCEMMESKISQMPEKLVLPEISRYLSSFCSKTCTVDMFGEALSPRMSQYCVKIAKFLPQVERVYRADMVARRFWIRGSNGKKYPFLLIPNEDIAQVNMQQRVLQLFRILNNFLLKNREVASRLMQFDIPTLIPFGPNHILLSDKESNLTLLDFLKQHCKTKDVTVEDLVARYYEKLLVQQTRGNPPSQQLLLSIMKDISLLVPKTALTNQIATLYPEATDYFTFRKQICLHMSVLNACEYLFSLIPVGTRNLVMAKDTGYAHIEFFVPEIKERLGEYNSRPVPFRLTPALMDFYGVTLHGYMAPAMTALGRCFQQQQLHQWLRVLLWNDDQQQSVDLQSRVEKVLTNNGKALAVLSSRLQALSQVENVDGRCHALIAAACSADNLCRMDPSWHPWF